jgi:hypothetical protein
MMLDPRVRLLVLVLAIAAALLGVVVGAQIFDTYG